MDQAELIPAITLTLGTMFWVAATRFKIGRILSPFSLTIIMILSIFAIRPLLMLVDGNYDFYGIDIASGFSMATTVGLVSVCCLSFGYMVGTFAIRRPAEVTNLVQPNGEARPRQYVSLSFVAATLLLALWLSVTVISGGGFGYLAQLFAGRSKDIGQGLANTPVLVAALPVVASLVISAARINFERSAGVRYSASQSVMYWVVGAMSIIPPSALGNRRFIIPSLIAIVVGAVHAKWGSRVKPRLVLFACFAFLALTIFPFVRSAGSRTNSKDLVGAMMDYFETEGLRGTLDGFFLSYDTEMFNYVAYLGPRLGESLPLGYGRGTVGELFLVALPDRLAPTMKWSNVLLSDAFGGTCAEVYCPVPSLPGTLFYDFHFVGVIVGMTMVGFACTWFDAKSRLSSSSLHLALVIMAFTVVIVRGNPISQIWIASQCFICLLVVDRIIMRLSLRKRTEATSPSTNNSKFRSHQH